MLINLVKSKHRRRLVALCLGLIAVLWGACTSTPALSVLKPIEPPGPQASRAEAVKKQTTRPAIRSGLGQGPKWGLAGIDPKWSEYGAYLQKMIDGVQAQWERNILNLTAAPSSGTSVRVKFVLNSEGNIASVLSADGTANELATRASVNAITDRAPYGEWTKEMKAALGSEQEMTFTFYYQ